MDELLATRYRLLFQSYAAGDTGFTVAFKRKIVEWNVKNGGRLRSDAALFLLVNLDHLIMRPYCGAIAVAVEGDRLLPLPNDLSANEWFARGQQATELILEHLGTSAEEISAHDVLRAIDVNWEKLGSMFWWG
jgi:hypothetical protein